MVTLFAYCYFGMELVFLWWNGMYIWFRIDVNDPKSNQHAPHLDERFKGSFWDTKLMLP